MNIHRPIANLVTHFGSISLITTINITMKLISNPIDRPENSLHHQRIKAQQPVRFMNNKNVLISLLLMYGICLSTTNSAFALGDKCKNVKITVKNSTGDAVKITKFEYEEKDKNKFRTELLLGVDGREFLNPTKLFTKVRDLAFVGGDLTSFRVTFQRKIGGTLFEKSTTFTTPDFVCKNDSAHIVDLK
jgi:hypothetical protein